jgi:hypothetical protein
MNTTHLHSRVAVEIALMRARYVARRCVKRAVELLLAVGVAFEKAVRFVASHVPKAAS